MSMKQQGLFRVPSVIYGRWVFCVICWPVDLSLALWVQAWAEGILARCASLPLERPKDLQQVLRKSFCVCNQLEFVLMQQWQLYKHIYLIADITILGFIFAILIIYTNIIFGIFQCLVQQLRLALSRGLSWLWSFISLHLMPERDQVSETCRI
jgi:hypothetical protein